MARNGCVICIGAGETVHEYIVESVVEPGVFVAPGYPVETMPTWYGAKLGALALEKIAAYLEAQTAEDRAQGSSAPGVRQRRVMVCGSVGRCPLRRLNFEGRLARGVGTFIQGALIASSL